MRIYFALLTLLASLTATRAATPTFDSFRQSGAGFTVHQPYIFVSGTNSGSTNYFINTTNIYNQSFNYITNSYFVVSNSVVTINGTNVATINPTITFIPVKVNDTNFGDSPIQVTSSNTVFAPVVDAQVVGVSNLLTGVVYSIDSGLGYGILANGPPIADSNWTNVAGYLRPFDLTTPLFWTNSVNFNSAKTIVFYALGANWILTNTSSQPTLKILNGSGTGVRVSSTSGGGRAMLEADGLAAAGLGVVGNSDGVIFQGSYLLPLQDGTTDISGPGSSSWFRSAGLAGTNFISGFRDTTATNYSRLAISHTGTNTISGGPVFDSQSNGSAGSTAQPLTIKMNGSQVFQVDSFETSRFGSTPTASGAIIQGSAGTIQTYSTATGPTFSATRGVAVNSVTAATSGSKVQVSPNVEWWSKGWATTPAASSNIVFGAYTIPADATNSVTGQWQLMAGNGAAFREKFAVSTEGPIVLKEGITKAQKAALVPENGMIVYQTDNTPGLRAYINGAWVILNTSADP